MGKTQKKTGKGRLDKYYKLAKEQGYRARSAFKLIHLNKKYSFLESARCCIDLCAAPGGWLQVASKYMPVNSIILGVDLVPIKSIPRVSTYVSDITAPECRNIIRNELKDWKADVVLHDGAPNVGSAWVQDAYSQAELVLMSLKLAVEFLIKGGIFITKVFRSADYNNLLWIFNQLFGKVEATKPPSSRNVSAEIFVVCRDFLAPQHIDPKFLDPKYAFKSLSHDSTDRYISNQNQPASVFQPEKKRRKRDGYDDGDYTLFRAVDAAKFVQEDDPIAILGGANQIRFDGEQKSWLNFEFTTSEIKSNCDDLKVLGKGDFKALLKWRLAMRRQLELDKQERVDKEPRDDVSAEQVVSEEFREQEELERLDTERHAQRKRERRKANEKKARSIQRMQLQMSTPVDIGIEQADAILGEDSTDWYAPQHVTEELDGGIASPSPFPYNVEYTDGVFPTLENEIDSLYAAYKQRRAERDTKYKVAEMRRNNSLRGEEWFGVGLKLGQQESDSEGSSEGGWDHVQAAKATADDDIFDSDSESEAVESINVHGQDDYGNQLPATIAARQWFSQDVFAYLEDSSTQLDPVQPVTKDPFREPLAHDAASDTVIDVTGSQDNQDNNELGLVTPEAVSLAQELVNKRTTKTKLINDGFNRYSFHEKTDLPSWFLDDEAKHYKINIPVTKEALAALRAKQKALDARPIKKVAEAKARKKMKAFQRLSKATRKAEGINESTDISERQKASQIQKLMASGASKLSLKSSKRRDVKVVVAKGIHKGVKGRPKGVKGRYAMVDARMRKELRAKKRTASQGKTKR